MQMVDTIDVTDLLKTKENQMAARDYKKMYNELNAKHKVVIESNTQMAEQYNRLSMGNKVLNAEFTKAVEANKKQQAILFEQRGIIGYLEAKISKLSEMLDDN